jgi:hypothetical protein
MLAIRTGRIEIEAGTGPRTATQMVWFPTSVIRACHVGLGGYRVAYGSGDHEVKTLEVDLRCSLVNTEFGLGVQVVATLFLCDRNADDPFSGFVDFVLFAELDQPGVLDPKVLDLRVALQ